MKFGTYDLFGPRKKPIDFAQNRSTISLSSHTNVLPDWDFMHHTTLKNIDNFLKLDTHHYFGNIKPCASLAPTKTIDSGIGYYMVGLDRL